MASAGSPAEAISAMLVAIGIPERWVREHVVDPSSVVERISLSTSLNAYALIKIRVDDIFTLTRYCKLASTGSPIPLEKVFEKIGFAYTHGEHDIIFEVSPAKGNEVYVNGWREVHREEYITAKWIALENKKLSREKPLPKGWPRVTLYRGSYARLRYLQLCHESGDADYSDLKFDETYYDTIEAVLEVRRGLSDEKIVFFRKVVDTVLGFEIEIADIYNIVTCSDGWEIEYECTKSSWDDVMRSILGNAKLEPRRGDDGALVFVDRWPR